MLATHIHSDEIFIVDDDPTVSDLLSLLFRGDGYRVSHFSDGESFASIARSRQPDCIILDVYMPGRSGLDILKDIDAPNYVAPIIVTSGSATIPMAVAAIKGGAFDILEKPFDVQTIVARVRNVIDTWKRRRQNGGHAEILSMEFPGVQRLTQREREVLAEITTAASNKEAALHLGLSPRTVEVHRAHIMMKLGAKNTADLVRLVLSKRPVA